MNDTEQLELRKDREFGEAISDIIALFKDNFKNLMGLYVRYGLSLMVVGFIIGMAINAFGGSIGGEMENLVFFGGLGNIVFVMFFLISTILLTAAIFGYITGYVEEGKEHANARAASDLLANSGKVFIIYFLIGAIMSTIGMAMVGLFSMNIGIGAALMFPIGIAMMYFMVKLMLTPYIATLPDFSISESFKESFFLTQDRWWWTFGLYFIISMIGSIMMYIVMIPLMVIMMVPQFVGGDFGDMSNIGTTMLISNFLMYAGYMIYGMILILLLPFMYYTLHDRKYGVQIEERIDNIERKRDSIFENEGEV